MRWTNSSLGILVAAGVLWATGGTVERGPAPPPLAPAEAQNYAMPLVFTIQEIERQYVRPVGLPVLARAALSGLYEAARLPVPGTLSAELEQVHNEPELLALLRRHRENLGDLEALHGPRALLASIRAITAVLDTYSTIVSGEELRRSAGANAEPSFGIELAAEGARPGTIKAVMIGSPAQKADIRCGDRITQIDGQRFDAQTWDSNLRPRAPFGDVAPGMTPSRLELTLRRSGVRAAQKVELKSATFKAETVLGVNRRTDGSWNYYVDDQRKLAHVRIAALGNGTSEDLRQVLTDLKADGTRGLILDLRWCPGGYLNEAVVVARLFLKDGTLATVKYRTREQTEAFPAAGEGYFFDFPLVVLVNGETSGGAELIAAALQDHQRATVAGQRTLGKASVQTMLALPVANAGLKLTTGTFMRPSGKALHRSPESQPADDWGVRPDAGREFPLAPDLSEQLRAWWSWQSVRPAGSKEALPLDDPENDPQRQAALQALRARCKSES